MALDKAKIAHLLRAAAVVTGHTHFVMVGSGSTIARYAPILLQMLETREIDLYIEGDADATDAMAILLGQDYPFDVTQGYYVDGLSPTAAPMPDDWRDRAKEVTLPMAVGIGCLCPEAVKTEDGGEIWHPAHMGLSTNKIRFLPLPDGGTRALAIGHDLFVFDLPPAAK